MLHQMSGLEHYEQGLLLKKAQIFAQPSQSFNKHRGTRSRREKRLRRWRCVSKPWGVTKKLSQHCAKRWTRAPSQPKNECTSCICWARR